MVSHVEPRNITQKRIWTTAVTMYQCVCIAIMKLQMNNGYLHKSEYLYFKELVSSTKHIIDGSSQRIYHSKLDHPTGHTQSHHSTRAWITDNRFRSILIQSGWRKEHAAAAYLKLISHARADFDRKSARRPTRRPDPCPIEIAPLLRCRWGWLRRYLVPDWDGFGFQSATATAAAVFVVTAGKLDWTE